MGFKFTYVCDLLSSLEDNRIVKASTAARSSNPDIRVIAQWFAQRGKRIYSQSTDRLALLSCLFPEKRTDRVYWLQDASLARIVGRCLLLGSSRREQLDRWRVSGCGDLGQCVEKVMQQAENHIHDGQEVTVEEIDNALNQIASRCRFSGPRVRRQHAAVDVEEALRPLYRRLNSRDAKWLTRMILKSYLPVILPVPFVLKSFHFLFPHLLLFQDSFDAALSMLDSEPMKYFPPHPEPGLARDLGAIAVLHLAPQIGAKIGRPEYYKARSIKHCCQMAARRRMSVERKYDGEYCQIHIDLSKSNPIQIFSKSGKDSTLDRSGVHEAIKRSLRIGDPNCRFSRYCILEGELLVWSEKEQKIQGFHKLRKFISRSGIFIGTENDSPPQPYEHLMVVFFDILLLDGDVCLRKPHRKRRLLLKNVVQTLSGHADLAEQEIIDFSRSDGQSRLERAFSKSIVQRWEGYVLKACDEPYFSIFSTEDNSYTGRWIKLKKDYIPGLGDTVDFALIGARYDSRDIYLLKGTRKISWTHFYVGCLVNPEGVRQFNAKPVFQVVDVVNRNCMNIQTMQYLNQMGEFHACSPDTSHIFDISCSQGSIPPMDVLFKTPFVVEILGSGFEKPSGARYFTLRFPRILKIYSDRTFEDAVSFAELQVLAEDARTVSAEEQSQEMQEWTKRLKLANGYPYAVNRTSSLASTASWPSESEGDSWKESSLMECTTTPSLDPEDQDRQKLAVGSTGLQDDSIEGNSSTARTTTTITTGVSEIESMNQAPTDSQNSHQGNAEPQSVTSSHDARFCGGTPGDRNTNPIDLTDDTDSFESPKNAVERSYVDDAGHPRCRIYHILKSLVQRPANFKSPLISIPIYLTGPSSTEQQQQLIDLCQLPDSSEATFSFSDFLQRVLSEESRNRLKYSNPHAFSHNITLGLIFIDRQNPSSFCTNLYRISNTLVNAVRHSTPSLPCSGKIFILSLDILGLGDGLEDRRFCLQSTWNNIGKVYFYASVTWGPDSRVASGRLGNGKSGEETGAGRASGSLRQGGLQLEQVRLHHPNKKIRVGFDRRELKVLGEFASIKPLVHAGGLEPRCDCEGSS